MGVNVAESGDGTAAKELGFADFHEQYIGKYIQLADAKAGTVLVAVTLVIGYVLGGRENLAHLRAPGLNAAFLLSWTSLALLSGSAVCAALVVWPRTGGVPYGLIFWDRVAAMERSDFVASIANAAPEELARERLEHCHAIAGTCARKYRWLRVSFVLGALALAASGALRLVVGG